MKLFKIYKCKMPSCIHNVGIQVKSVLNYFQDIYGVLEDEILFDLKVILNELILNAVKHGNNENEMKFVRIKAFVTNKDKALIIISDDGHGYDFRNVLERRTENNNIYDIGSAMETGRGILIVSSLCDVIKFNKKGNRICVIKSLSRNRSIQC